MKIEKTAAKIAVTASLLGALTGWVGGENKPLEVTPDRGIDYTLFYIRPVLGLDESAFQIVTGVRDVHINPITNRVEATDVMNYDTYTSNGERYHAKIEIVSHYTARSFLNANMLEPQRQTISFNIPQVDPFPSLVPYIYTETSVHQAPVAYYGWRPVLGGDK